MALWCIMKTDSNDRVRNWPAEAQQTFRTLDKSRKLEGFRSKEEAEAAMPTVLAPYCTVREYASI